MFIVEQRWPAWQSNPGHRGVLRVQNCSGAGRGCRVTRSCAPRPHPSSSALRPRAAAARLPAGPRAGRGGRSWHRCRYLNSPRSFAASGQPPRGPVGLCPRAGTTAERPRAGPSRPSPGPSVLAGAVQALPGPPRRRHSRSPPGRPTTLSGPAGAAGAASPAAPPPPRAAPARPPPCCLFGCQGAARRARQGRDVPLPAETLRANAVTQVLPAVPIYGKAAAPSSRGRCWVSVGAWGLGAGRFQKGGGRAREGWAVGPTAGARGAVLQLRPALPSRPHSWGHRSVPGLGKAWSPRLSSVWGSWQVGAWGGLTGLPGLRYSSSALGGEVSGEGVEASLAPCSAGH